MKSNIIFSSKASKTLQETFDWYEVRSEGLGLRFVELIDKSLKLISQNPESFPAKINNYREFVLNKFPYIIVYEYSKEQNAIYILHIFHTKRNPKQKLKRTIK